MKIPFAIFMIIIYMIPIDAFAVSDLPFSSAPENRVQYTYTNDILSEQFIIPAIIIAIILIIVIIMIAIYSEKLKK